MIKRKFHVYLFDVYDNLCFLGMGSHKFNHFPKNEEILEILKPIIKKNMVGKYDKIHENYHMTLTNYNVLHLTKDGEADDALHTGTIKISNIRRKI